MSVCIEQKHHNNFSQYLPTCEIENQYSFQGVIKQLQFWIDRSRQRKHLARLDDRMLEDIGLTRDQVLVEINKPFWK